MLGDLLLRRQGTLLEAEASGGTSWSMDPIPLDATDLALNVIFKGMFSDDQSHASYFTFNLVAILAELRAAFGVLVPTGVGKVTGWD